MQPVSEPTKKGSMKTQQKFFYENNGVVGSRVYPSGTIFYASKDVPNDVADEFARDKCNSGYAKDVFSAFHEVVEYMPDLARQIALDYINGRYDENYGYVFYQFEGER